MSRYTGFEEITLSPEEKALKEAEIKQRQQEKEQQEKEEYERIIKEFMAKTQEFLQRFTLQALNSLRIRPHKKSGVKPNYDIKNHDFYVDKTFVKKIEALKEKLLLNEEGNNEILVEGQTKTTKINKKTLSSEPIFQTLYQNTDKERIKKVLSKIPLDKLTNLELRPFKDENKPIGKYEKLPQTNYRGGVVYYLQKDLPIIREFIYRKRKGMGYAVYQQRAERKQIIYKGKRYPLQTNVLIYQEKAQKYFLDLEGKYYKLLIENYQNDEITDKKAIVLNSITQLSNNKKQEIQALTTKISNQFDSKIFKQIWQILEENQ
ncbi:hypothetical protein [Candidatus Phytoplasma pruni]|uniref:Uncharacterized protein n=1 Tax=Candidatus Phytoplasma pruni TaxID=479893 RepID=A0A851HAK0_9MOLU|nr:hypothetical protein [Candidatus Phytoplasma pruni]NWN45982.1 hypothetical protein [Candidatus Phytoplasma pruni]